MRLRPGINSFEEYYPKNVEFTGDGVFMTFLGTNSILIRDRKTSIIIDPYFTRPGRILGVNYFLKHVVPNPLTIRKTLQKIGIGKIDAVLLTHTHIDHALDAPEVVKQTNSVLYGSSSAMQIGRGGGLDESSLVEIDLEKKYKIGAFKVTFIKSVHLPFPKIVEPMINFRTTVPKALTPPARIANYRVGEYYKFQIEHPYGKLFVCGGGLEEHPVTPHADAVTISIGGLALRSVEYRENLFERVVLSSAAKSVYLTHWDKPARSIDSPAEFLGRTHITAKHFIEMAGQCENLKVYLPQLWSTTKLFAPKKRNFLASLVRRISL